MDATFEDTFSRMQTHLFSLESSVPTSELDTGGDERREGVPYSISTVREVFPRRLKKLFERKGNQVGQLSSFPSAPSPSSFASR